MENHGVDEGCARSIEQHWRLWMKWEQLPMYHSSAEVGVAAGDIR
jgi:hypothetical protein